MELVDETPDWLLAAGGFEVVLGIVVELVLFTSEVELVEVELDGLEEEVELDGFWVLLGEAVLCGVVLWSVAVPCG